MSGIENTVKKVILHSRWLVAPFLLGLVAGLGTLLYSFVLKLISFVTSAGSASQDEIIVGVLKLVDFSLTANLLLIVICSTYENFVGRLHPEDHKDWPTGLIGIGFSGLKQKLLGSVLAIAAVNVLEWFIDIDRSVDSNKLAWVVGILLALAVATLLLAAADRLSNGEGKNGEPH